MKYAQMLEGRHALILGGASPVGQAVVKLFAEHGAKVAVADEGNDEARQVFAGLAEAVPGIKTFAPLNYAAGAMQEICASVLKNFPRVDILVSAPGFYKYGDTPCFSLADFRKMLDINLACAIRCFQEFLPGMKENRRGELVFIAPDLADASLPKTAAAAACAGAVASFARNVTMDYIRYHIRANTVFFPLDGAAGREPLTGAPEPVDAANAALWYACDLSRFVTGESIAVNGGMSHYKEALP